MEGDHLVLTDVWERPKRGSDPGRLSAYYGWLVNWLLAKKPDLACVEFLSVERNAQTTRVVAFYQAASAIACKSVGLVVIEARVSQARAVALGDGSMSKDKAFAAVRKLYPNHDFGRFDRGGSDRADAVVLARAAPSLAEM